LVALKLKKKPEENPDDFRTIYINDSQRNAEFKFADNYVRTTRYTLLSFLPKNVFEQLHRLANVYFLFIGLLQVFTTLSSTGQYTTIGPLLLILGVSAMKDAVEDFGRFKSDRETNNRPLDVLGPDGQWEKRTWKEVNVGDIVRIHNRQFFPADILILCSSEPLGTAYIETSNLDGETNLKTRQALPETNDVLTEGLNKDSTNNMFDLGTFDDTRTLNSIKGAMIKCELPNNRLRVFKGNMDMGGKLSSLSAAQLLLRGAQLRQTRWAIGTIVFSGYDTKVVRNSSRAPSKRSNIELRTNDFIVVILTLMLLLCALAGVIAVAWSDDKIDSIWYMPPGVGGVAFILTGATYLILLSTMVPISLYVTMEIVKMMQAFHMMWDLEMYDAETKTFTLVRSSGLNEELGQVEYIFSDKTGTLTQNLMEFRKCTVGTIAYGKGSTEIGRAAAKRTGKTIEDDDDPNFKKLDPMVNFRDDRLLENLRNPKHPESQMVRDFLTLLSVCHTVVPEGEGESLIYQAESPDEAALVAGAKTLGFVFHSRTPKTIGVTMEGKEVEYEILNTIEFNSDRKRMSVIVKSPEGKILLFTKGADVRVFERLAPNQPAVPKTHEYLEEFATEGLRTLCCGMREIPYQEWADWNAKYDAALTSLKNRKENIDAAAELIEQNLVFVGTTAIEDKLQDGVSDTIATLARANIKIWVLTGDKQETAINIGFACSLLNDEMVLLILNKSTKEETRDALYDRWTEYAKLEEFEKEQVAIVIDGDTLGFILEDYNMKMSFLELGKRCKAVVCCRVTPSQKADVTKLVKIHDGRICLAIGDGANDVAMIQAAHVGVGISGREGLQAVQSSDYAIAQFRFLKKLLLVHGHWNYRRISRVITFNFYKNMCLYMTQFWFGIYNMWSGMSLYESWTQGSFNVFFTSLPILAYGILDKDVSMKGIYAFPSMYRIGQDKLLFNARMFAYWLSNALGHSVICFLIPLFLCLSVVSHDGTQGGLFHMGLYTYTGVVYTCCGKILLMSRSPNWVMFGSIVLSIFAWFLWLLVYSNIVLSDTDLQFWNLGYQVLKLPNWWLGTALIPVAALSRDLAWRAYKDIFLPNQVVIARYVKRVNKLALNEAVAKGMSPEEAKAEQERRDARMAEVVSKRRMSNIATMKQNTSGVGFVGGERDAQGMTDWEKRISKVMDREKRKKEKREKMASKSSKKQPETTDL